MGKKNRAQKKSPSALAIPRIGITGIGIVSPIGTGKNRFWNNLTAGHSGIRKVTLFDTQNTSSSLAGEIRHFTPKSILGSKGLRLLDRTTLLGLCATQLAIEDSHLTLTPEIAENLGVVLASTCGSVSSRSGFFLEALEHGHRNLNPALFPNTVVNSPASQIAIRFGLRGVNCTISTGFTGVLEAFEYAANFIRLNRSKAILVGGAEELAEMVYISFSKSGLLSSANKKAPEICAPFDQNRNGTVLGEGAVIFLMENITHAQNRGAHIYAEYRGGATLTDFSAHNRYNLRSRGPIRVIEKALKNTAISPGEVDFVAGGANGTPVGDAVEARALNAVLGGTGKPVIMSASKSILGESFSASGGFQAASALLSLERSVLSPTINISNLDKRYPIDCTANTSRKLQVNTAMIASFSPMCQQTVCLFSRI